VCHENNLLSLQISAEKYIFQNFESIVRDDCIKTWASPLMDLFKNLLTEESISLFVYFIKLENNCLNTIHLLNSLEYHIWSNFTNWLDILWFSYHIDDKKLKQAAVSNLIGLINVDNVVSVIVGAHAAGEKEVL
jgi:hypothetical protein